MPAQTEELIRKVAKKKGQTQTAVIMEAVDEKFGLKKNRRQLIRELAGWMSHAEAEELRNSRRHFEQIHAGDWE
jgi:hypothetical protein